MCGTDAQNEHEHCRWHGVAGNFRGRRLVQEDATATHVASVLSDHNVHVQQAVMSLLSFPSRDLYDRPRGPIVELDLSLLAEIYGRES